MTKLPYEPPIPLRSHLSQNRGFWDWGRESKIASGGTLHWD